MSSRPGSTVVANRRSSAARVTGSAVAKASPPVSRSGTGSCSTNSTVRADRQVRSPQVVPGRSPGGTNNTSLRRIDNASSRPIAVAARASLSQSKAGTTSRSPRTAVSRSLARGCTLTAEAPPLEALPSTFDDESLALALARELENERLQDEAFALALAREEEETSTSDAALAAALAAGDNRAVFQPWTEFGAGDLAAIAAAASLSRGNNGMLGVGDYGLEEILALTMGEFGYTDMEPPRRQGPSISQIQRLPTRLVCAETLCADEDGTEPECPVCFATFAVGEELRTLPCMHSFHTECIDRWLTSGREGAATCPVCHCDVDL